MHKTVFVVPFDFTPVSENAFFHALKTAQKIGAEIRLLHIASTKKNALNARLLLKKFIQRHPITEPVKIYPAVVMGNLFHSIGSYAEEKNASLIFMGTHGAHGWQHVIGSNALKVINRSTIPFVVVQDKPIQRSGYNEIVVPLDLHKETRQKLAIVANLASYFDSRIHLIVPDEKSIPFTRQVEENLTFASHFLQGRKIAFVTIRCNPKGFDKEVVKYAVKVNADLIAIMNIHKHHLLGARTTYYEQYIITNDAKIPALVVNPITVNHAMEPSILF